MDNLPIYNIKGEKTGDFELPESVRNMKLSEYTVKEAVVARLANQRGGNASTKTKGDVSGSGKKPWRQKGTGRARVASIRSPLWRSGGVIFGPHPRDYSVQLPKKMKKKAFSSAVVSKMRDGKVLVVETLDIEAPKTKKVAELLLALGIKERTLIVDMEPADVLKRATRNLADAVVRAADGVDTYDIVSSRCIVMSKRGLEAVLKRCES